ncbi:hypothetical protein TNCV_4587941 [Trichonephila clavipes]|uniref:Uncharacterized protein n=1 Tax=Trichonephila clavipes TaxID=2585209 RepID=A0A8X6S1R5_TRICX|nr:hypothetical protein TNCV_4587941 [Trichonephila clavipes]
MRPDSRVVPGRKKFDKHPPPCVRGRRRLSSFRVHQDATGQQSSPSTEKRRDRTAEYCLDGKKVTNTHRRAPAVGCRCHRSACTKTRPDSRVVPRRKKDDEHPPSRVRGRMSLSSFRVQQDETGQQSSASTEKGDEHPPPRGRGRMSLSSFRVHQDATGQQGSASTKKDTKTHRRASAVGCRCHRSACNKTRPDSRVGPQRKKDTNTHHHASAVRCRCHCSACNKTRPDSRVMPRRKKVTNTHRAECRGRMSLSSFRVHQDATGQQSSARDGKI